MKVTLDPDSGFCFGVERAIQIAESELAAGKSVYCIGDMVHNQAQMDQLQTKGLKVVSVNELHDLKGETVLIRAHGEPPTTYRLSEESGVLITDATCPIVKKLQQSIKECAESVKDTDNQIVIFGKPGHAEVIGLLGNAGPNAIVVSNESDLEKIDFSKPVRLFSQTTMDDEKYQSISASIQKRMKASGNHDLVIKKSVCMQVAGRAPALRKFASASDVLIFVGGRNSANGAYLFNISKAVNPRSYYVTDIEDIDINWFDGTNTVGVSGATSTPGWLTKRVADFISNL
jgi:4-hydroxy-3-methylbut-2-enyl diphosphate reductase